jgi:4-diphosphocytidyl-2-C-methyl-D-erythritol kinase
MNQILNISCPAKLNLMLKVVGKRADGMHEIKSHFQLINLFDELTIQKANKPQSSVTTNSSLDIENDNNIVYKAILSLSKYIQQDTHCKIHIIKNIPIGGGLGGGSSNAAAALIGINKLYNLGLSISELMVIGAELGADVPFFIFGKNAMATGIGEVLEEVSCINSKFLIVAPNVHTSTKEMFAKWDELDRVGSRQNLGEHANSFLPLFLSQNIDLQKIYDELSLTIDIKLSGTGSTMFCIYKEDVEIEKTLKKIPTKWRHFFCEPLQCSPLLQYIT